MKTRVFLLLISHARLFGGVSLRCHWQRTPLLGAMTIWTFLPMVSSMSALFCERKAGCCFSSAPDWLSRYSYSADTCTLPYRWPLMFCRTLWSCISCISPQFALMYHPYTKPPILSHTQQVSFQQTQLLHSEGKGGSGYAKEIRHAAKRFKFVWVNHIAQMFLWHCHGFVLFTDTLCDLLNVVSG